MKGVQVEIKEIRAWKTTLMSFSPTRNSSVFTLSCLSLETETFGEGEICGKGQEAELSLGAGDTVFSERGRR